MVSYLWLPRFFISSLLCTVGGGRWLWVAAAASFITRHNNAQHDPEWTVRPYRAALTPPEQHITHGMRGIEHDVHEGDLAGQEVRRVRQT